MILGILIRSYKCYNNLQFIPLASDDENKYSVLVGNNGVGKSTVLESLDTFFNNREWNINKNGRKDEAFVAPVFLIKKDELLPGLNSDVDEIKLLNAISDCHWQVTESANPNIRNTPGILRFLNLRDELLRKGYKQEEHYLFIFGINYHDEVYFSTFHKHTIDEVRRVLNLTEDKLVNQLNLLRKLILEQYSYIYIPVEMPISDVLKMETQQMQTLMNKDILEEIDAVLRQKVEIEGRKINFIDFINNHLNNFMKDINDTIRNIDESYSYNVETNRRKNLTPAHIREKILEAYFPIRTLKKSKREINELSSGEQRQALIDIIYAFLTIKGQRQRNIIIAIDEPESSLHISNCFRQFQRLEELANNYNNQMLITTHWYGFMPITSKGSLIHIDSNDAEVDKIKVFDFRNYLEEKRDYPDSVELKSTFDLAISIIAYMKSGNQKNWIICEGSEDKTYLQYMLKERSEDFIILPVGGCGNVIKIFQLLYSPISEKIESKAILGKILCLIDTDTIQIKVPMPFKFTENAKDKVLLRRLQITPEGVNLVDPFKNGTIYQTTEIEDCLNPVVFYKTICQVLKDINIKEFFEFNQDAVSSNVSGDNSILKPKTSEAFDLKRQIITLLEKPEIKLELADTYVRICKESEPVDHDLGNKIIEIIEG